MTYISKLHSWLRCVAPFLPAAALALLLCVLFDGPRLGTVYDFLLKLRRTPPVSHELLIIDSAMPGQGFGDDILEPGAASSLLYTMTELGAGMLIIQVPILGLSAGGAVGEEEILYHFDEEFSILSRNIRNLFEGIKTGSVAPSESARYVGELVELSEKGKERLVSALVRRDEEGIVSMEKAAAFFGHARRPGDLRVQLIRAGQSGQPGVLAESGEYSRVRPDRDGVLRRVAPIITAPELSEGKARERTLEHIIYGALNTRYKISRIEYSGPAEKKLLRDKQRILALRDGPDEKTTLIPLDKSGAVLVEIPHQAFRQIGISDFLAYDETNRSLRRLLLEGESLGIFKNIEGENHPAILYDYALSLREEPDSYFSNGLEEKRLAWIEARGKYFANLENFLNGPAKVNLTSDSQMQLLAAIMAKYGEVLDLRKKLESELASSFCILGNSMDVEASALLANSILSGRFIKPGNDLTLFLLTLVFVFLICFIIKSRGPVSTLGIGGLFVLLIAIGFSSGFIISGIWLNPLVPIAASTASVLVSCAWAVIARSRYSRRFRLAYGPFVSRNCLKTVIQAGKPLPSQVVRTMAAVVVIKNADSVTAKKAEDPRIPIVLDFHAKVSFFSRKNGGTVTGAEGDLVTVCFGSPLERVFLARGGKNLPREDNPNAPALRAVDFVSELTLRPECKSWHFGLAFGNCTFTWTALSGYFATGVSIQRARVLSRMASRHKARILISSAIYDVLPDLPAKKLDLIGGEHGKEAIYRLSE